MRSQPRGYTANRPPAKSAYAGIVWPAVAAAGPAGLRDLLKQLEYSQWFPPDELRDYQLGQLQVLLRHARATIPYYASSFAGLDFDDLNWNKFASLPRLGRPELQERFAALRSRATPASHGKPAEGQSSGSTGTPIRVRVENQRLPNWGSPVASIYSTGPAAALNVRTDTSEQLDWLLQEDPDYLITHTSNLGALAELSLRKRVRLPRLRQARSFSEALRPALRETVRAAWGVEIADVYSCEEAGYIALQCPQHEHYHVQAENLIVEILDADGKPCAPGETGEVVLTTLHNFAMPLIRYRLGDYAEFGDPCPCGRGLPVLRRIHGRQRNMLRLPDGRQLWPSFPSSLWLDVAPLERFQVIQRGLRDIEVNYVMSRNLTPDEETRLAAALTARLGFAFTIDWQRREHLEPTRSGKFEIEHCPVVHIGPAEDMLLRIVTHDPVAEAPYIPANGCRAVGFCTHPTDTTTPHFIESGLLQQHADAREGWLRIHGQAGSFCPAIAEEEVAAGTDDAPPGLGDKRIVDFDRRALRIRHL